MVSCNEKKVSSVVYMFLNTVIYDVLEWLPVFFHWLIFAGVVKVWPIIFNVWLDVFPVSFFILTDGTCRTAVMREINYRSHDDGRVIRYTRHTDTWLGDRGFVCDEKVQYIIISTVCPTVVDGPKWKLAFWYPVKKLDHLTCNGILRISRNEINGFIHVTEERHK